MEVGSMKYRIWITAAAFAALTLAVSGAASAQDTRPSVAATGLPAPSGEVWLFAPGVATEIKVQLFDERGEIDEEALAELDEAFRCRRTGETRAVSPQLYVLLSHVYDHFGQRRIELVSGFRNQRNEGSRHFHASAMDIRVPGVSVRELAEFAERLDTSDGPNLGIGRYPRDGWVHIDIRAPGEPSYRWVQINGRQRQLRRPSS
jgi:uncharacterized protein YcbK (DUF882 family)